MTQIAIGTKLIKPLNMWAGMQKKITSIQVLLFRCSFSLQKWSSYGIRWNQAHRLFCITLIAFWSMSKLVSSSWISFVVSMLSPIFPSMGLLNFFFVVFDGELQSELPITRQKSPYDVKKHSSIFSHWEKRREHLLWICFLRRSEVVSLSTKFIIYFEIS